MDIKLGAINVNFTDDFIEEGFTLCTLQQTI